MNAALVENPEAEPRTRPVLRAVRRAYEVTFAEPVADGRPIPSQWPAGLGVVGGITAAMIALLAAVAAFSGVLRAGFPFIASTISDRSIPEVLMPAFILMVGWTLGLLHCALIRVAWYIKLPAVIAVVSGLSSLGLFSSGRPLIIGSAVAAYLAVIVIMVARRRRPYAWWEFPLVTTLVGGAWMVMVLGPGSGTLVTADLRFAGIEQALEAFGQFAMPALVAAGVAPALVTVSAAEAVASRPVPRTVTVVGVTIVVVWRIYTMVEKFLSDRVEQGWPSISAAIVTLILTAIALGLVWRLSPQREVTRPGDLPELWIAWSFPVSVALMGIVILIIPVITVFYYWQALGLPGGSTLGTTAVSLSTLGGQWWRLVPGTAFAVGAALLARRGRVGEASLLASVFVVVVSGAIGSLLPAEILRARTADSIAGVTSLVAIVVLVVTAAFGELTRRKLVGLLTVLLVGGLFTYRDVLDDPVSAVLGFAGLGTAIFGLVWQGLTSAGFTRRDSRRFPQATRVLVYLANNAFAFCIVAFSAASRRPVGSLSLTDMDAIGDYVLGTPLLLAATVLGLAYGFGARERRDDELPLPRSVRR